MTQTEKSKNQLNPTSQSNPVAPDKPPTGLILPLNLSQRLAYALLEDAPNGDITSQFIEPQSILTTAQIIAKEPGVFSGVDLLKSDYKTLGLNVKITLQKKEGDPVKKGEGICELKGNTRDILRLERPLLNLLQRTCGIASLTKKYVNALNDPKINVLDTRKTTPLWRDIEKKAVVAGGGFNHRMSLSDMVLIKENHLTSLGIGPQDTQHENRLQTLIQTLKTQKPQIKIQIEVESLTQLSELNFDRIDYILLDNMNLNEIQKAVKIRKQRKIKSLLEVSGNVSLDTIHHYKGTGIHRISIGKLTHSVPSLDLSLRID